MTATLTARCVSQRPLIMGVLNLTPDSFSDGGRWFDPADAIARGVELTAQGAGIVDVGGESTRPGADRVDEPEELRRVVPVVRALVGEEVLVSVDTMRARVAAEALEAGASMVNDVSGGLADPAMGQLVAAAGVPMVVMHWRGQSAQMHHRTDYTMYDGYAASSSDASGAGGVPAVVAGVAVELAARISALHESGVTDGQLILDPGLGFAKTTEHNWQLLAHLDHLAGLGFPVLLGASRKRFLATLTDCPRADQPPDRDLATSLISLVCAQAGAWGVRVHDVSGTVVALRLDAAIRAAARGGGAQ